jgi:plasmid stabilization system protein ParE
VSYAVIWSRKALDDVKHAAEYVAKTNPDAARRIGAAIRAAGDKLGYLPTGRPGRVSGTYEKVVPGLPYILAYAVEAEVDGGEAVVILRAIHGARNWPPGEWPE